MPAISAEHEHDNRGQDLPANAHILPSTSLSPSPSQDGSGGGFNIFGGIIARLFAVGLVMTAIKNHFRPRDTHTVDPWTSIPLYPGNVYRHTPDI